MAQPDPLAGPLDRNRKEQGECRSSSLLIQNRRSAAPVQYWTFLNEIIRWPLIWEGLTNREIGKIVGTSEQMIKNHLRSAVD